MLVCRFSKMAVWKDPITTKLIMLFRKACKAYLFAHIINNYIFAR